MTINKTLKNSSMKRKKKPAMNKEVQEYDHCQQTIKKNKKQQITEKYIIRYNQSGQVLLKAFN